MFPSSFSRVRLVLDYPRKFLLAKFFVEFVAATAEAWLEEGEVRRERRAAKRMPLGKYYCDYCDKQFQDTPAARKRHLQGTQHQRARALWYDSVRHQGELTALLSRSLSFFPLPGRRCLSSGWHVSSNTLSATAAVSGSGSC